MNKFNLLILLFMALSPYALQARDLEINGRVQGVAEGQNGNTDLYLRRVRVNTLFTLTEDKSIYFDIRSDNMNRDGKSNDRFQLGDAYYKWKTSHLFFNNITLFRAKVDVSYSQTSSS